MQNGRRKNRKVRLGQKTQFIRSCKNFWHPGPLTGSKPCCLTSPYNKLDTGTRQVAPFGSAEIHFRDFVFSRAALHMPGVSTAAKDYFVAPYSCPEVLEAPVGLQNAS